MRTGLTKKQKTTVIYFDEHGSGTAMVEIEPKDVVLLIHIAYLDIFENEPDWFSEPFCQLAKESCWEYIVQNTKRHHQSLLQISERQFVVLMKACILRIRRCYKSLWNKGRTSIQGQALYVRSARQAARRTIEVQVVLRHFVPNKGQHPLRRYAAIHSVLTVNRRLCKCGRYLWTNTRKACRVKKFTA